MKGGRWYQSKNSHIKAFDTNQKHFIVVICCKADFLKVLQTTILKEIYSGFVVCNLKLPTIKNLHQLTDGGVNSSYSVFLMVDIQT